MTPELQALMNMIGSTDQGYSSGQRYAQSIAGGENIPGMIAPGVSYSMERPEGYTQSPFYNAGPVPVMPSAPTQGNPLTIENQMPFAPPGVTQPERYTPMITNAESLKNLSDLFNANMPSGTQVSLDPFIDGEPMAIDDLMPSVSSSPIDFSFNPFEEVNEPVNVIPTPVPTPAPAPLPVAAPVDMPFRPDPIQFEPEPFFESIPYQPVTTIEDFDIPVDVIPELPVVSLQDLPTGPVDMPFIPNEPMPSVSMQDYNDQLIKELLDPTPVSSPIQNFGGYNNVRSFLR
jgi:hypothetical protein